MQLLSLNEEASSYLLRETVKTVEEALKVPPTSLKVSERLSCVYLQRLLNESRCSPRGLKMIIPESTKFEMYRDFIRVKDIAPHNMLALLRGETEEFELRLSFDEEVVMSYLE